MKQLSLYDLKAKLTIETGQSIRNCGTKRTKNTKLISF